MKKILLPLLFAISQAHGAVNVKAIQDHLFDTHAQWSAKSNWISELPAESLHRMLGNNELPTKAVDYSDAYSEVKSYEALDWRNKDSKNWLGPVMNQGNCGSCVAFATIATVEAQISISSNTPWLAPKFSPQALFACGRFATCETGWYTTNAASDVVKNGIVDNACAPYTMGSTGEEISCQKFCENQESRTTKIAGWRGVNGVFRTSAAKVKEALKHGPLVTAFRVYEDFLTYSGGIYKATSKKLVGGHAVSIVGYNDAERYWIIRNSWGEEWGEKGFARVSWDDKSGVGSDNVAFDVKPTDVVLGIKSPEENAYVSGKLPIVVEATSTFETTEELYQDGKFIQQVSSKSLDTSTLEDGKYELVSKKLDQPEIKSLVRGFTILNHSTVASITFSGHELDLTQPMKGRGVFSVDVESQPIQLQSIDFVITKLDGTFVTKRTTDVVLNHMLIGFRFNNVEDGAYLIFFRGRAGPQIFESEKVQVSVDNHL